MFGTVSPTRGMLDPWISLHIIARPLIPGSTRIPSRSNCLIMVQSRAHTPPCNKNNAMIAGYGTVDRLAIQPRGDGWKREEVARGMGQSLPRTHRADVAGWKVAVTPEFIFAEIGRANHFSTHATHATHYRPFLFFEKHSNICAGTAIRHRILQRLALELGEAM